MNAYDAILWKSGREKVDADLPLTEAEREALTFYGGDTLLRRPVARVRSTRATKQRQRFHTTSLDGKLRFS